jgi:hypothetical protein
MPVFAPPIRFQSRLACSVAVCGYNVGRAGGTMISTRTVGLLRASLRPHRPDPAFVCVCEEFHLAPPFPTVLHGPTFSPYFSAGILLARQYAPAHQQPSHPTRAIWRSDEWERYTPQPVLRSRASSFAQVRAVTSAATISFFKRAYAFPPKQSQGGAARQRSSARRSLSPTSSTPAYHIHLVATTRANHVNNVFREPAPPCNNSGAWTTGARSSSSRRRPTTAVGKRGRQKRSSFDGLVVTLVDTFLPSPFTDAVRRQKVHTNFPGRSRAPIESSRLPSLSIADGSIR